MLRELHEADWFQVRQSGSHRILRHRERSGVVVVPGAFGAQLAKAPVAGIVRQAGLERRS
jgi:predicted RNA binding protein YcfA (HicA-like mRNA interferase family)